MLTTFQRDTYPFLIRCLFVCFSVIVRFSSPKRPLLLHRHKPFVANNPVRCEKLGCCRNVFFCNFHILFQSCENIVFFLAVIILIQPANDLDSILPIILWYQLNHLLNDTAFTEQIVWQKKLCMRHFGIMQKKITLLLKV